MKRFIAVLTLATVLLISFGAISTQAQAYVGYDVDADYGGELLDEPLWEINFFLDGRLMYAAVAEESLIDYTQEGIDEMMMETWGGYQAESECFYDQRIINIYYVSE